MKTGIPAVVTLCVLSGCGHADPEARNALVRDSSGVTIVENRGPYEQWRLAAAPEVRIGIVEGAAEYQFHRIQFAGRLSDGRVVVADGSRQVRWYDATGAFRSAVGGQGGGPGEFGAISGVLITPADTLIVYDLRNRRASWLSPAQQYVRDISLRDIPPGTTTLLAQTAGGRLALATTATPFVELRPGIAYSRDTLSVFLVSAGNQLDTVMKTPGQESGIWAEFSGGRPDKVAPVGGLTFGHRAFAVATADQYAIVDGKSDEIRYYGWTGSTMRISRRMDVNAVALTEDDRRRYVAEAVKRATGSGPGSPSAIEEGARNQLDALPSGHTMPVFDAVLSDSEGRIWLRDFVPTWVDKHANAWTVINPAGRVERRVAVPVDITLTHVGGEYVTGVARDSLEVEYVVVYRLEKT